MASQGQFEMLHLALGEMLAGPSTQEGEREETDWEMRGSRKKTKRGKGL